jgi:regulator of cell morphogenesis and NO signaling
MEEPDSEETIGEIVARNYSKAIVFKTLGIDFSCGGKQTLAGACKRHGLTKEEVLQQLNDENVSAAGPDMDFKNWDIGFMCDYMIQLHHLHIKNNTPFIKELSQKICNTYAERHKEIVQVAEIFEHNSNLLMLNIAKEEKNVFPYIIALNDAHKNKTAIKETSISSISAYMMETEHEKVIKNFSMLRTVTNDYLLPPYVPHSYGILYKMLQEYEDDVHLHLHLENNILFPKAISMENEMIRKKNIE